MSQQTAREAFENSVIPDLGIEFEPVYADDDRQTMHEKIRAWLTIASQPLRQIPHGVDDDATPALNLRMPVYDQSGLSPENYVTKSFMPMAVCAEEARRLGLTMLEFCPVQYGHDPDEERYAHTAPHFLGWSLVLVTDTTYATMRSSQNPEPKDELGAMWQRGVMLHARNARAQQQVIATDADEKKGV